MDCRTARDLLPLYFDGELDRATGREFEAHLDGCADCRAELVALDELRRGLREDAPRYRAPDALRERIARSANAVASNPSSARRWPWRYAAALVVAFVAGGSMVSLRQTASHTSAKREQTERDLLASHWRALAAASPVDVVSSDRHTVKPWFAGKVADAPPVEDFANQGFALIGGRIDYVGSARVPVLVYRHGQHVIDVFVLASADATRVDAPSAQNGYRIEPVRLGGQPAAIVTDMDETELAKFARLLAPAS